MVKWIILFLFGLFFLLAFKNPFSTRSLVPNLEPFPDTLFYSIPSLNFVKGNSFTMQAYGYKIKNMVPPLYGIILTPFFILRQDIRMFYFANLILGFSSLTIFLLILNQISKSKKEKIISIFFGGFLYVTTYHFYNLPSLLMAENLSLLIGLISVYLLFLEVSKKRIILSSYIGLLLLLTKFSNFPIALVFHLLYFVKVFASKNNRKENLLIHILNLISSLAIFSLFLINSKILIGHANLSEGSSFTLNHFSKNLVFYIKSLLGSNTSFVWYQEYLLNKVFAFVGLISLIFSILIEYKKDVTFKILAYLIVVVGFMSIFYYADSRYILIAAPLILIEATILIYKILNRFSTKKIIFVFMIFISFSFLISTPAPHINNNIFLSLKNQIMLNFRHQETPWNYLAILHFNQVINNNEAYLITTLPAFYVESFSGNKYKYLPLSLDQEFSTGEKNINKSFHKLGLHDTYQRLLESKKTVYISNYYLHVGSWEQSFDKISEEFKLELISEGCMGSCNVYKLSLSNDY